MQLRFRRRGVSMRSLWVAGIALMLLIIASIMLPAFNTEVKADRYQLVKLTTGEIFFGKLQNTKGEYLVLENVYFIQDSKDQADTTILSRKSTVAKSESPMRIKADKMVYWENLAKDSKIAQSIQNAAGN